MKKEDTIKIVKDKKILAGIAALLLLVAAILCVAAVKQNVGRRTGGMASLLAEQMENSGFSYLPGEKRELEMVAEAAAEFLDELVGTGADRQEMIERLPSDGLGILNYDNEFIRNYKVNNNVKTVTYGIDHEGVDYRAEDIVYTQHGSSFTIVCEEGKFPMETKLLGKLNILNILSAVACARHLGVQWNVITRACRSMKQVEHRLELKTINGIRFIDDAFNANPSGSAMALDVLSMMPGKRVIVTPGMIDLGKEQDAINRHFGELMKDKADVVVLVGV